MADVTATPPATAAPRRPGAGSVPAVTWLAALAVFAVVLILLAWRMLGGDDPALGAPQQQPAAAPAERVIVRRIIRRTIIVTGTAPAAGGGAPAAGGAAATAGSRPARLSAAPAPAPAATAPAPAPVTRSS